jgi:SAM-dependent methyltransferase
VRRPAENGYARRASSYAAEHAVTVDQPFLASLVDASVTRVLEVPCGAGRNAAWLAATGREVVLVDREPRMVAETERVLARVGRGAGGRAAVGDMRRLDLDARFDLILVPQEGFQMVTGDADARSALRSLARHLAPGGRLLIDLATFEAAEDDADARVAPRYFDPRQPDGQRVTEWVRPLPGGGRLRRARTQYRDTEHVRVRFEYDRAALDGESETWTSTVELRRHDPARFLELLAGAGLHPLEVLRDYDRRPFAGTGTRMITLSALA